MLKYDCVRCGACCANSDHNRAEGFAEYVEVFRRDTLMRRPDLLSLYAVRNERGQVHLRLRDDNACVALEGKLGQSVHCGIYASRPSVCRQVTPGSEECLRARAERGVVS